MALRSGRPAHDQFVEWRAERIGDPIQRLQFLRQEMQSGNSAGSNRLVRRSILVLALVGSAALLVPTPAVVSDVSDLHKPNPFPERRQPSFMDTFANVWVVDETDDFTVYSNGLRIDNTWLIANVHRFYQVLDLQDDMTALPEWRSEPAGIVYHTTESPMAPFEPGQNHTLRRFGHGLLKSIRNKRSYNFVIDRFGRVWRVVPETDAANHSGNSIWADSRFAYLNLNSSFIGVAFEAQTDGSAISNAQIHSGRILTEVLRAKYRIGKQNCITHAQVSVNPWNGLLGYHTDWAAGFPFLELGLSPNYDLPVPAVRDFGFEYDGAFRNALGPEPWKGLAAAEGELERTASSRNLSIPEYREALRDRYRKLYAALRNTGSLDEAAETRSQGR